MPRSGKYEINLIFFFSLRYEKVILTLVVYLVDVKARDRKFVVFAVIDRAGRGEVNKKGVSRLL